MFVRWMDELSMVGQDACEGVGNGASIFTLAEDSKSLARDTYDEWVESLHTLQDASSADASQ